MLLCYMATFKQFCVPTWSLLLLCSVHIIITSRGQGTQQHGKFGSTPHLLNKIIRPMKNLTFIPQMDLVGCDRCGDLIGDYF